jgi:tetratricopeptide (TPR) repeat protein
LLIRRAWLALMQGELEEGADFLQRASTIHQEIGDRYALAQTLTHLGTVQSLSGRFAEACALMEQGLELAGEVGDRASMAWIPSELGEVNAFAGHYREARNLVQMAFSVARHAFDPREIAARFHRVLGWAALAEEAYAEAQEWLEKSVGTYRTLEHYLAKEWMSFSLAALGRAACGLGDLEAAQAYLVEGLRIALEMKNFIPLLSVMPIIPLLLADRGQKERAVELYALAASQPFVSNSPLFEAIAGRHIAALAAHPEGIPPEVVQAAQARGRARDMWATAAELLEELAATDV